MFKYFIALSFFILSGTAYAQGAPQAQKTDAQESVVYESPTIEKFSRLYWALGKFDDIQDKNQIIDNYLKINECQLYKDYAHNEFEWSSIRESTLAFLEKNKRSFPVYFSFVQPLRFSEYDMEKKAFEIWGDFQVAGARSFEMQVPTFYQDICGSKGKEIPGYPRALFVELSRPFELRYVPMTEKAAQAYIKHKTPAYVNLKDTQKTKESLYESRDAYIVMKVKVFTYKEDIRQEGYALAKVLSVLDRFEIYEDPDLKTLLYAEDLNAQKQRSSSEMDLKKQYQERLKKQMQEKHIKTTAEPAPKAQPAAKPKELP